MRYALIKNDTVVDVRPMPSNFSASDVAHKFDYRPINLLPDPAYNALTEKLSGWDYTINPDSVDAVRVVVPLTQAELDALADQDEREQAKALYLALKNGEGTQAVRLARVEKVLARLLKDAYA